MRFTVFSSGILCPGSGRPDTLVGTAGDDTLYGYGNYDDLRGGDGNDLILGGAGNDVIGWMDDYRDVPDGEVDPGREAGRDTMGGGDGRDVIGGGDGDDWLSGGAGDDALFGGDDNDTLIGGAGANVLVGEGGNDRLIGGAEADTLYGGGAWGQVFGNDNDTGNDTIHAWHGDDTAYGGAGDDWLLGQDGQDTLFGETGADTVMGGNGDDVALGGAGADLIGGGAGHDLLIGGLRSLDPRAALLPDFDPGADTIAGGAGDDTIIGGGGADLLQGATGDDLLRGGDGADTLAGGTGDDTLTGGAGDDLFHLAAGSTVTITDFRIPARSVTLTFDELEAGSTITGAYGGLVWGAVDEDGDSFLGAPDTTRLDEYLPVTVREGGSIRSGGALGISDPDGRLFVVEGGIVIKSAASNATVTTWRDGAVLETFSLPYMETRPDLATALAGMLPADHIEIVGITNIGGYPMSVPLDSLSVRWTEPMEQDLLRVAGPGMEAGLLASATDVAGGVAMSFGGVSVTVLGHSAAEASGDWFF
jgi:hypothetical protein